MAWHGMAWLPCSWITCSCIHVSCDGAGARLDHLFMQTPAASMTIGNSMLVIKGVVPVYQQQHVHQTQQAQHGLQVHMYSFSQIL